MTVTEFFKTSVPFLSGLTDVEADALATSVKQLNFKPGQTIIMQGVTVDGLHVIAEGKVAVSIRPKGKTSIQVAILSVGDVFGERSVLEFGVAGATIKAIENCLVFMVPQDTFLKMMESNPQLKQLFMDKIAERRKPLSSNPKINEEPPKAAPPPPDKPAA